jgi:hypothetical protein
MSDLYEEIDKLSERLVAAEESAAESQFLAYKWMVAHDRLKAGESYEFPAAADLPEVLAPIADLERRLSTVPGEIEEAVEAFGDANFFRSGDEAMRETRAALLSKFASLVARAEKAERAVRLILPLAKTALKTASKEI